MYVISNCIVMTTMGSYRISFLWRTGWGVGGGGGDLACTWLAYTFQGDAHTQFLTAVGMNYMYEA